MALRNYTDKPTLTAIAAANGTLTAGATTCILNSVANLPVAPFTATFERGSLTNEEVVLVTAVNTGTATVTMTRGYDGTTASSHNTGVSFEHTVAGIDFTEANAHVNATTGIHGATGSLVDTGSTQTISGAKTFSAAPEIDADIHIPSATRRTLYPTAANVGLQVRSNGTGLLELNTDNAGDVKIAGGGGKAILGAGGLQLPRGASINTDGGTANTVMMSETTAAASFTGSVASDLIIKEPNGQRILLGTHGAAGVQNPTLLLSSTDAQVNDSGTMRSLPRGSMYAVTHASGSVFTLSTTLNTYTTVYTAPTATYRVGRRYLLRFFGAFIKSSASGGINAYDCRINNGATVLGAQTTGLNGASAYAPCIAEADWAPGVDVTVALTVTVAQTVGTVTAASTVTNSGSGGYLALVVIDVGS